MNQGVTGGSVAALLAFTITLASPARAEDLRIREMITCDALAKAPPLLALGVFGVRSVAGAVSGGSAAFLRTPREERLLLASLGVAGAGHAFCGPAIFLGHAAPGRALLSLGLRLGLPGGVFALTYGAYAARTPREAFGSSAGDVVGSAAFAGMILGGFAMDYVLILWERAPRRAWGPVVGPGTVGIGGAF